jgi:hypothetical protein
MALTNEIEGLFTTGVYEFHTLAFWHLHAQNNARKTHTLHKPSDHCTENSHVGVDLVHTEGKIALPSSSAGRKTTNNQSIISMENYNSVASCFKEKWWSNLCFISSSDTHG